MAEEKSTVDIVTLKTIRTPVWRICPVCHEDVIFEKIERIKNGKKVSEELIKKSKHTVRKCIDKIQTEKKSDAGWTDVVDTCSQCGFFVSIYHCGGDTITYCTNPNFVFESTDEIAAFQKEVDKMDYIMKPKTYEPARTIYAWIYEDGMCNEFERE